MRSWRRYSVVAVVAVVSLLMLLVLPSRLVSVAGTVDHDLGLVARSTAPPVPGPCPARPMECAPTVPPVVSGAALATGLLAILGGALFVAPLAQVVRRRRTSAGRGPTGTRFAILRPPR